MKVGDMVTIKTEKGKDQLDDFPLPYPGMIGGITEVGKGPYPYFVEFRGRRCDCKDVVVFNSGYFSEDQLEEVK